MSTTPQTKSAQTSLLTRISLSRKQRDVALAWLLVLPAFAILLVVIFGPIIHGITVSFTDYTLKTRNHPTWNNFENYKKLFDSGEIYQYFRNTLVFVGSVVVVQLILAMGVALLLNTDIKGRNIFRGLFLLPWTIPSVVVALLFSWMLQPQYGVFNYIFYNLGLVERNQQWLQHPQLAMVSIIAAAVWRQAPMMIVMFLAGLQAIPRQLIEAAQVDGANNFQVFRSITLPSLRPVISTTVLIAIINNFQMFTIIYNMTKGGPLDKTKTLSIATYTKAFTNFDMGVGAAIGVLWLVALLGISTFYNRYFAQDNA